jgi:hypothetical protein
MIEVFEKKTTTSNKRNKGSTFEDLSVDQVCLHFNSFMLKIPRFEIQRLNINFFLCKKCVPICMFNTIKLELVCFTYLCFSYGRKR